MKRVLTVCVVGFMLVNVSGCGGSPDGLMKEMISGLNSLADSMEKGESEDKQKAIADKLKATSEKLDKLKHSEDQKKALVEKHKDDMTKAMMRLMAASMKQATTNPNAKGPDLGSLFK
jgi:biopolymer transport protein ExbB/TolQ